MLTKRYVLCYQCGNVGSLSNWSCHATMDVDLSFINDKAKEEQSYLLERFFIR